MFTANIFAADRTFHFLAVLQKKYIYLCHFIYNIDICEIKADIYLCQKLCCTYLKALKVLDILKPFYK